MKITKIEVQKRNKDRVSIYIDNKFAFGIDNELRYKYNLSEGKEVEEDYIQTIIKAEEQNKVNMEAMNLISYRQRTVKEMQSRLKRKGYEDEYIKKAIEYCKSYGYIDDKAFANSYINDKRNLNKLGSNRIKYELIEKGVSKEIINEVLEVDENYELEMAMELALKRINSYKNDDKVKKYRKLSGYLQRRGYSYSVISKVMDEVLD